MLKFNTYNSISNTKNMNRYEMRIHRDEFVPLRYNNNFYLKNVETYDEHLFNGFIESINTRLSDWNERPTLEDVNLRLSSISNCYLFYHKNFNVPIGWGWFSTLFTYDWINEVHPLPTKNSIYYGGTYVRKDLNIPIDTGIQMYNFAYRMFFEKYDYIYGYMDGWNKAPQKICHKLGTTQFNFIQN